MAESYFELLKHPEWQKKRLRCMEAAGFACQECRATDRTLNVHHRYYTKGAKPWEYPDDALVCLCEECHEERHRTLDEAKKLLGFLAASRLLAALGYIKGMVLKGAAKPRPGGSLPLDGTGHIRFEVDQDDPSESVGLGDAWFMHHISYTQGIRLISKTQGGITYHELKQLWESKSKTREAAKAAAAKVEVVPSATLAPSNIADCRM